MAAPAAVLSILVRANTGAATTALVRFNQRLDDTEKHSHKTARAIETVAKAGALIGGAAVIGGLTFAVKKAADFEQQMSSLGAVSDASAKQMDQFRKQAVKAGAATKFSALEAAQAQTELAKGGLSVKQIMRGGLRSALALAAAGELDLADAASTTVNAMKLFGLRGKDSMKVADALATAANKTTADVSDFAMALTQGGGAAKAAGLNFTSTVTVLEALAEVGVKNSDAGTSMKTALLQLIGPTQKQAAAAKQAGVNFLDQHGRMKDIADISKMLRDKTDGMTKAQRAALFQTLAGTDGFRTLLALYDAGPKKLQGMEKGLGKQGTAADVAKKKQDNLKGSLENLGGSVETLAIQIGEKMLPALQNGATHLTNFTNRVGRIFARDDLSIGEKLSRSFKLAKVEAGPWIDKLKAAIDQADIPKKLAAVISAATPVIVKAAAMGGVAAAKTFAGAFASSNIWGKLVLGGWLLSRMGGKAAWFKMGATAGTSFGEGMAATGGAGGAFGLVGKFKTALVGLRGLAGRVVALDVAVNLVDSKGNLIAAAINTAHDLTFGIVPKVHVASGNEQAQASIKAVAKQLDDVSKTRNVTGIAQVVDKIKAMAKEARAFGRTDLGKQLDKLAGEGENTAGRLNASQQKIAGMSDRFAANLRGLQLKGSKSFDTLVGDVTFGSRQILKVGGDKSTQTREAIAKQFRIARDRVKTAMDDQVISVKDGMTLLHQLAVKELGLYGIKAGRVNVVLAKGANGQARPNQRGGFQMGGKPTGDSIPSLLERGEYVLNRKAVRKVGKHKLDELNFASAPRFQKGGAVGMQGGGSVTGDTDFLPAMLKALKAMSSAAHTPIFVQSGRRTVAEQLAQGPSTPNHPVAGPNGPHVRGVAADITPGFNVFGKLASKFGLGFTVMPQEPWHVQLLKAMGGLGPDSFNGLRRPVLSGPSSVALEAAQGALDRVGSAANASVAAAISSTFGNGTESPVTGGNASGNGAGLMKAMSKARGWNFADWWALDASETSHGANLSNPTSSARLRGQFLDSNWGKYGPGSDPRQNPSMGQQIQSMAEYIAARYGNPTKARAFHRANNFYQQGGLVGMAKGGAAHAAGVSPGADPKTWAGRGRALMEKVWPIAQQYLPGAGAKMPTTKFTTGLDSLFVGADQSGTVYWPKWLTKGKQGLNGHDNSALETLIHEWTHVYQNKRTTDSFWKGEGGAVAFAREFSPKIYAALGIPYHNGPVSSEGRYAGPFKRVRKLLGEKWISQGQFMPPAPNTAKGRGHIAGMQKGGLSGAIGKTLGKVRTGRSPKIRHAAVANLVAQIKKVALPKGVQSDLTKFSDNATIFGEYADRAGALSTEDDNGNPIFAMVNGKNQAGWLTDQLNALFNWRNTLIRAEALVVKRREKIIKALTTARKRLDGNRTLLGGIAHKRGTLAKQLKVAKKHPKRNRKLIHQLNAQIRGLNGQEKPIKRSTDALHDKIIPALVDRRGTLGSLRGDLLSSLDDVQGVGAPSGVLKSLPAVGVLGGQIFDVQMKLKDLAAPPNPSTTTDAGSTDTTDNGRADILAQLLQQANLRTAISQAQFKVFQNSPPFGGSFATGGVVAGPSGAPRVIEAHGGEGVFTPDQMAAMGGASVTVNVAPGMEWLRQFISVEVGKSTRQQARGAARGLPGRGGGIIRG